MRAKIGAVVLVFLSFAVAACSDGGGSDGEAAAVDALVERCRGGDGVGNGQARRACSTALNSHSGVTDFVTQADPSNVVVHKLEGASGTDLLVVLATLSAPRTISDWPLEVCAQEFVDPLDGVLWLVADEEVLATSPKFGSESCLPAHQVPRSLRN